WTARGAYGWLARLLVASFRGPQSTGDNTGVDQMAEYDAGTPIANPMQHGLASEGRSAAPLGEQAFEAITRASGAGAIAGALAAVTRADAAVGPATSAGGYTVVPLKETIFYAGYVVGMGSGTSAMQPGDHEASAQGGGGGSGG